MTQLQFHTTQLQYHMTQLQFQMTQLQCHLTQLQLHMTQLLAERKPSTEMGRFMEPCKFCSVTGTNVVVDDYIMST